MVVSWSPSCTRASQSTKEEKEKKEEESVTFEFLCFLLRARAHVFWSSFPASEGARDGDILAVRPGRAGSPCSFGDAYDRGMPFMHPYVRLSSSFLPLG